MKKILIAVGAALVLAVVGLLLVASFQPDQFRVTRSLVVQAPADKVFGSINDLRQWEHWSPWAKLDPAMKVEIAGEPSGVGATYHWSGNAEVGEGRMTIVESVRNERVGIRLEFLRPMESLNSTVFVLRPEGNGTQVEWSMSGTNNLASKVFALLVDMDRMVGGDFEKGLSQLKARAEGAR